VTGGTIFQATKLPLTTWFLGMHLLTQAKNNVSALELTRHLDVRYKTAWLLKHKLMQVMTVREESRQLDGRVEIDDAYLGGELVVCTAAMKDTLFSEPRPLLPPGNSPPR